MSQNEKFGKNRPVSSHYKSSKTYLNKLLVRKAPKCKRSKAGVSNTDCGCRLSRRSWLNPKKASFVRYINFKGEYVEVVHGHNSVPLGGYGPLMYFLTAFIVEN